MWEKHTTDTGQSFGKDLGAARSRLGSAHDVMPRVVVVVIVIVVVVVVVQIPASREAELGRHIRILYVGKTCKFGSKSAHRAMRQKTNRRNVASF